MQRGVEYNTTQEQTAKSFAADPVVQYMDKKSLKKAIEKTKSEMNAAAKELDFNTAARLRDEMFELEKLLAKKV